MSRLGKLPIELPAGTQAKIEKGFIIVKGPKGEIREKLNDLAKVEIGDREIKVSVKNPQEKREKSLWGLYRSLINNLVIGVNEGFEKKLEISGVGYRAAVSGNKLVLNLGFSHPIEYNLPEGVTASVEENVITLKGLEKKLVGETAAKIKKFRIPDPYKAKGIKYSGEVIRRKAGKTASKE
ncbi:MAG: 50S ribosomal protein L6 [Patescibacteria group bacterium]|nr:50S ribosomal protein L6 [Patescibacteria group bacterium]